MIKFKNLQKTSNFVMGAEIYGYREPIGACGVRQPDTGLLLVFYRLGGANYARRKTVSTSRSLSWRKVAGDGFVSHDSVQPESVEKLRRRRQHCCQKLRSGHYTPPVKKHLLK